MLRFISSLLGRDKTGGLHKEIIVNADPAENRVAILEKQQLTELHIERPQDRIAVGSIYKGRVSGILPGMQSAFVDLGIGKHGFLHVDEIMYEGGLPPGFESDEDGPAPKRAKSPKISNLIKSNQEIIVQITKEPIGTKGPRLTNYISLPGRTVVLMPGLRQVGISRRIEKREERERLKKIAHHIKEQGYGLIMRTASFGASEEEIKTEVNGLIAQWQQIQKDGREKPALSLLFGENSLPLKIAREYFTDDVKRVVVDDPDVYKQICDKVQQISPKLISRVQLFRKSQPIFESFGIEEEIDKLLRKKVWLKCGGYLLFDTTEALFVIDVNTGKFVGKKSLEQTVLRANVEAAEEVARQLRLRDAGGIIIIDFIDMEQPQNREKVLATLSQALKADKAKTSITEISELGLVEMTRKRVRESLEQTFMQECPYCGGRGQILSARSLSIIVQRLLVKLCVMQREKEVTIKLHPEIASLVKNEAGERLERIRQQNHCRIDIVSDPSLHWEEIIAVGSRGRVLKNITGKGRTTSEQP